MMEIGADSAESIRTITWRILNHVCWPKPYGRESDQRMSSAAPSISGTIVVGRYSIVKTISMLMLFALTTAYAFSETRSAYFVHPEQINEAVARMDVFELLMPVAFVCGAWVCLMCAFPIYRILFCDGAAICVRGGVLALPPIWRNLPLSEVTYAEVDAPNTVMGAKVFNPVVLISTRRGKVYKVSAVAFVESPEAVAKNIMAALGR
jgi:hypothetical protein